MVKVITYGTFDHLHQGHINLLKRAKSLGDYLIVGVTTENFDIIRGKINVQQPLMERIEAVKDLGIADEVFPEEYEGQKIDDIKRYGVDIFAIGSDWIGKFDYLKEYCEVVYLPRTKGISSTQIRSKEILKLGIIGDDPAAKKLANEVAFVDGLEVNPNASTIENTIKENDVIYVACRPYKRYQIIKKALEMGKHIISESPIATTLEGAKELFDLAQANNLCLYDSIKTAYSLAFSRLVLLVKSGIIGDVKSIDSTCTSQELYEWLRDNKYSTSFPSWGSIGLLPVLKILGLNYITVQFLTLDSENMKDIFTKITFNYGNAVATVNVGIGVKSESDLRIAGTKGYIYVPSPWWKTEYFEVRFEDPNKNRRYFYKLEGEGLRTELVHFVRTIHENGDNFFVEKELTIKISELMELHEKNNMKQ